MKLAYYKIKKVPHLIEKFFSLEFSKDVTPFNSKILPVETSLITYIYSGNQTATLKNTTFNLSELIITGQFFRSFHIHVEKEGFSVGMHLHPTALYKILNTNVYQFRDQHVSFKKHNPVLAKKIETIFLSTKDPQKILNKIELEFSQLELKIDKNTKAIDSVIQLIRNKEGLLDVNEILIETSMSQKNLETQFKKIAGITPGKYIRLYRFYNLMSKYERKEMGLQDLIYMYNYYDHSHFAKDFKLFMYESPKEYFQNDYPFLKEYLAN
jgi:AraC-like DNA-binding protein